MLTLKGNLNLPRVLFCFHIREGQRCKILVYKEVQTISTRVCAVRRAMCGAENLKFQIVDKLYVMEPGFNEVSAKDDTKMAVRAQNIIPISEDSASRRLHSTQSASQVTSEKWVIVDWESPGPGSVPCFRKPRQVR